MLFAVLEDAKYQARADATQRKSDMLYEYQHRLAELQEDVVKQIEYLERDLHKHLRFMDSLIGE